MTARNECVSADYRNAKNPLNLMTAKRLKDGATLLTFIGGGTLTVSESIAEIDRVEYRARKALQPLPACVRSLLDTAKRV